MKNTLSLVITHSISLCLGAYSFRSFSASRLEWNETEQKQIERVVILCNRLIFCDLSDFIIEVVEKNYAGERERERVRERREREKERDRERERESERERERERERE